MIYTKEQIISDFQAHINKSKIAISNWYVGIAKDGVERLHSDHKVPRKDHWFIRRQSKSDTVAREIEKYFLDRGADGGGGGGDEKTVHVYAYVKTSQTDP